MKTIYVKKTNNHELRVQWNLPNEPFFQEAIFIRCNKKGEINWDKAPVYKASEIVFKPQFILINQ